MLLHSEWIEKCLGHCCIAVVPANTTTRWWLITHTELLPCFSRTVIMDNSFFREWGECECVFWVRIEIIVCSTVSNVKSELWLWSRNPEMHGLKRQWCWNVTDLEHFDIPVTGKLISSTQTLTEVYNSRYKLHLQDWTEEEGCWFQ